MTPLHTVTLKQMRRDNQILASKLIYIAKHLQSLTERSKLNCCTMHEYCQENRCIICIKLEYGKASSNVESWSIMWNAGVLLTRIGLTDGRPVLSIITLDPNPHRSAKGNIVYIIHFISLSQSDHSFIHKRDRRIYSELLYTIPSI